MFSTMYFTEHEASRLAVIQQTDSAAAAHHLSAVKNLAVSSLTGSHSGHHTNGPPQFGLSTAWPNIGAVSSPLYTHPVPLFMPKSSVGGHIPTSPWIL